MQSGGQATGNAAYLNNVAAVIGSKCTAENEQGIRSTDVYMHAFQFRAAFLITQWVQYS